MEKIEIQQEESYGGDQEILFLGSKSFESLFSQNLPFMSIMY